MLNQNTKEKIHGDYEWIRNIIVSCSHEGQLEITSNVIELFDKKYKNSTYVASLEKLLKQHTDKILAQ